MRDELQHYYACIVDSSGKGRQGHNYVRAHERVRPVTHNDYYYLYNIMLSAWYDVSANYMAYIIIMVESWLDGTTQAMVL